MNAANWPPRIGTFYLRWDKNEIFQVAGYDQKANRVLVERYDGTAEEIDQKTWCQLSPSITDPPEDWTEPVETMDAIRILP